MELSQLAGKQVETLRAISNIGMDHAAAALSQLLQRNINLKAPRILTIADGQLPIPGGVKPSVIGVCLCMQGDARGKIVIVFSRESALNMLDNLLSREESGTGSLTELESSALMEVGNILASSFLNALGGRLRITLVPSVPALLSDIAGTVAELARTVPAGDEILPLLMETEFFDDHSGFSGHFLLLPDHASIDLFLGKTGA
ncbi:MAG TPA: chemotaxis protein CheC [Geobacteraceae bacterium]|nr:chemotaxis protein CheC [Geobacteraceae bacterium]